MVFFFFLCLSPASVSATSSLQNLSTYLQPSYCTKGPWKPDDLRRGMHCHSFFGFTEEVQGNPKGTERTNSKGERGQGGCEEIIRSEQRENETNNQDYSIQPGHHLESKER